MTRDSANLQQFHTVVTRAYEIQKTAGKIVAGDIDTYDKLIACPAVVYQQQQGWVRPINVHKQWRRRVRRRYLLQHATGPMDWLQDIDWEEIWNWVLENIVPILKMLLAFALFII
jgi:hypothetical protein